MVSDFTLPNNTQITIQELYPGYLDLIGPDCVAPLDKTLCIADLPALLGTCEIVLTQVESRIRVYIMENNEIRYSQTVRKDSPAKVSDFGLSLYLPGKLDPVPRGITVAALSHQLGTDVYLEKRRKHGNRAPVFNRPHLAG